MKERKVVTTVLVDDEEGVDRISNLPEPLVHKIMSSLPTTDVAITSSLSKKFNSFWRSFPFIAFDQNLFLEKSGMWDLQSSEVRDRFLDFVVDSIQLRQLTTNLNKFSLKCNLAEFNSDPRIDMAINFALNHNVKDFYLNFPWKAFTNHGKLRYLLKETFYFKSVIFLKLKGVELNLNWLVSTIPLMQSLTLCHCYVSEDDINPRENDVTFTIGQSLRFLSFKNVNITDEWVRNNINKFPSLEILRISNCRRLKFIWILNETLKEVEVDGNFYLERIEIVAPALVSFQHSGSIRRPCAINIAACMLLEYISLKAVHVTDEWISSHVSLFSHLEKLRLEYCLELVSIQVSSNRLQSFELNDCKNLVEVNIDCPNLNFFEYSGVLVFLRLMNTPRLRNPVLKIISNDPLTNGWFAGLRDFLTMFDHCETVTLVCRFYQDLIFPKDLRNSILSPLYDIKGLLIKSLSVPDNITTELVDSLLWISPHAETLCFASESVTKIIKVRYGKRIKIKTYDNCCNLLPIKCWRHDLKGVELNNIDDNDDKEGLLRYFMKECEYAGNSLHQLVMP